MLFLAAAALAATQSAAAPARQAQAVVRIVRSPALRFAEIEKTQPKLLRDSRVRSSSGAVETARLIEFQ